MVRTIIMALILMLLGPLAACGKTPEEALIQAAAKGHTETVETLLARGADAQHLCFFGEKKFAPIVEKRRRKMETT